ncbi:MAG: general secretion pathway protein GspB [Alteromonadaceae bacterium]|nr:general secretion pathway protein GspB [Alteromonadaceae bacterium]
MSDLIKIAELKPGMVIIRITEQNGPVKIRKSGLVSSDAMVQGLAEMGVQEVEVDPAQAVEIEKPVHHRTQTQALLRGEHDTSVSKFDAGLSDQFNRSLFLPTVQGMPSLWKVYTRQAVSFAGVILAGLITGGAIGSYPAWWPDTVNIVSAGNERGNGQAIPGTTPEDSTNLKSTGEAVVPDGNNIAAVNSSPVNNTNELNPVPDTTAGSQPEISAIPNQSATPDQRATGQQNTVSANPANRDGAGNDIASQASDLGGEIINAPQESDVNVSPELMARFNKAIEDLDNKATEDEPETQITVRDDLPRVDQLPVRMLTRLPGMAFNAHMYASRPSDRWVRVNGKQLGEGDWIDDKVQIVKIEAQRVILSFENKEFSMAALTDW